MNNLQQSKAAKMKIGAILPYYGSKRTIATEIVAELGRHEQFYDVACGSLAVPMAKPVAKSEIVNDLNGDVTCLAWTLAHEETALQLYERVGRSLFSEAGHAAALDYLKNNGAPDGACVEFSYQLLVASWQGRNGTTGQASQASNFCVRWNASGGDGGRRWASVAESIPDWHQRLKRLTILNRDLFDLLPKVPDREGTVVYVDPPYLKKSKRYKCEFAAADHRRLAEDLRRFEKTRVVVSYYAEPQLADLYDGWTFRPVKATKYLSNAVNGSRGAVDAPEVLLINGPSLTMPTAGKLLAATRGLF